MASEAGEDDWESLLARPISRRPRSKRLAASPAGSAHRAHERGDQEPLDGGVASSRKTTGLAGGPVVGETDARAAFSSPTKTKAPVVAPRRAALPARRENSPTAFASPSNSKAPIADASAAFASPANTKAPRAPCEAASPTRRTSSPAAFALLDKNKTPVFAPLAASSPTRDPKNGGQLSTSKDADAGADPDVPSFMSGWSGADGWGDEDGEFASAGDAWLDDEEEEEGADETTRADGRDGTGSKGREVEGESMVVADKEVAVVHSPPSVGDGGNPSSPLLSVQPVAASVQTSVPVGPAGDVDAPIAAVDGVVGAAWIDGLAGEPVLRNATDDAVATLKEKEAGGQAMLCDLKEDATVKPRTPDLASVDGANPVSPPASVQPLDAFIEPFSSAGAGANSRWSTEVSGAGCAAWLDELPDNEAEDGDQAALSDGKEDDVALSRKDAGSQRPASLQPPDTLPCANSRWSTEVSAGPGGAALFDGLADEGGEARDRPTLSVDTADAVSPSNGQEDQGRSMLFASGEDAGLQSGAEDVADDGEAKPVTPPASAQSADAVVQSFATAGSVSVADSFSVASGATASVSLLDGLDGAEEGTGDRSAMRGENANALAVSKGQESLSQSELFEGTENTGLHFDAANLANNDEVNAGPPPASVLPSDAFIQAFAPAASASVADSFSVASGGTMAAAWLDGLDVNAQEASWGALRDVPVEHPTGNGVVADRSQLEAELANGELNAYPQGTARTASRVPRAPGIVAKTTVAPTRLEDMWAVELKVSVSDVSLLDVNVDYAFGAFSEAPDQAVDPMHFSERRAEDPVEMLPSAVGGRSHLVPTNAAGSLEEEPRSNGGLPPVVPVYHGAAEAPTEAEWIWSAGNTAGHEEDLFATPADQGEYAPRVSAGGDYAPVEHGRFHSDPSPPAAVPDANGSDFFGDGLDANGPAVEPVARQDHKRGSFQEAQSLPTRADDFLGEVSTERTDLYDRPVAEPAPQLDQGHVYSEAEQPPPPLSSDVWGGGPGAQADLYGDGVAANGVAVEPTAPHPVPASSGNGFATGSGRQLWSGDNYAPVEPPPTSTDGVWGGASAGGADFYANAVSTNRPAAVPPVQPTQDRGHFDAGTSPRAAGDDVWGEASVKSTDLYADGAATNRRAAGTPSAHFFQEPGRFYAGQSPHTSVDDIWGEASVDRADLYGNGMGTNHSAAVPAVPHDPVFGSDGYSRPGGASHVHTDRAAFQFSIVDANDPGAVFNESTPRPRISWGFGGTVVVISPKSAPAMAFQPTADTQGQSSAVKIYGMSAIARNSANEEWRLSLAAAPMVSAPKSAGDLEPYAVMCDQLEAVSVKADKGAAESCSLLWRLLSVLCRNPTGDCRAEFAAALAAKHAVPTLNQRAAVANRGPLRDSAPAEDSAEAAAEVERLLGRGKREDAVTAAKQAGLWSLALVISAALSRDVYMRTVADFARNELKDGATLQTHCLAMSENYDEIVRMSTTADALPHWKRSVAVLLERAVASRDAKAEMQAIEQIGVAVAKSQDDHAAAHVCGLVSGTISSLSSGGDGGVRVLGVDLEKSRRRGLHAAELTRPVLQSVVFEAVLSVNGGSLFAHLLPLRLVVARNLAEVGRTETALQHCEAIMFAVKKLVESEPPGALSEVLTPPFLASLESLEQQLRGNLGRQDHRGGSLLNLKALKASLVAVFADAGGSRAREVSSSRLSTPASATSAAVLGGGMMPGVPSRAGVVSQTVDNMSSGWVGTPPPTTTTMPHRGESYGGPNLASHTADTMSSGWTGAPLTTIPPPREQPYNDNGSNAWNQIVSSTIDALAPAHGDISPPVYRAPHVMAGGHNVPAEMSISSSNQATEGDEMGMRSTPFGDIGERPPMPGPPPPGPFAQDASHKSHPDTNVARRLLPDPSPHHRRSSSDTTYLESQRAEKPPRPPGRATNASGKGDGGGGDRDGGRATAGRGRGVWRLSEKIRAAFSFGGPPRAHMGEDNKFVYDKEKGRWFIPGEEDAGGNDAVPPCPPDDELMPGEGGVPPQQDVVPGGVAGSLPPHETAPPSAFGASTYSNATAASFRGPVQSAYYYSAESGAGMGGTVADAESACAFGDNTSESSFGSVASAPVLSSGGRMAPTSSAIPGTNRFRARHKLSGARAYVDTFNAVPAGNPKTAHAVRPAGRGLVTPSSVRSSARGVSIFTPAVVHGGGGSAAGMTSVNNNSGSVDEGSGRNRSVSGAGDGVGDDGGVYFAGGGGLGMPRGGSERAFDTTSTMRA